jgi:hypothetical protein
MHNNQAAKIFVIFFVVFSTSSIAFTVRVVSTYANEQRRMEELQMHIEKRLDLGLLAETNDGHGLSKYEFIVKVLLLTRKLDQARDVDYWLKVTIAFMISP